jgi:hypothetical protein
VRLAPLLGLLALLPILASCRSAAVVQDRRLILTLNPPELKAGEIIQVTAKPVPQTEMAWVSGTVKIMGAPVMPFKRDENGEWSIKTMLSPLLTITPGSYQAKAWGDDKNGLRYEGNLSIDVK